MLILWRRMRDDVFIIWRTTQGKVTPKEDEKEEIDDFMTELNQKEERIKFTIEKEKDGGLSFLDLLIKREGNQLFTTVFRKSTHAQKYLD